MIQIATAIKTGADVASSAGTSSAEVASGAVASPFLALFAKTLSSGVSGLPKGLIPLDSAPSANEKTSATSTSSTADGSIPGQDLNSLSLMQSLVMPAMLAVSEKTITPATGTNSDPSGETAALGQDAGNGKNLPNLMAALAGREAGSKAQIQLTDSSQTQPGTSDTASSASSFLDVLAAKASNVAASSALVQGHAQTKAAAQSGADSPLASLASLANQAPPQTLVVPAGADKSALVMQTGFGSPGWSQELGDKVVWMSTSQGHASQLVLNPPSLGAVEVRLQVNGSEAGAQFYSANADVRNAIEAAMPKLREMLAGAGISLGETTVSNQSFSQRDAYQSPQQKSADDRGDSSLLGAVTGIGTGLSSRSVTGMGTSLLDYYA
jgi:flagellar hook-length control protein FliK